MNSLVQTQSAFDLVLKGGTILDGTGNSSLKTDVGLVGDTIAALGEIDPERASRLLDVTGLYVSPGFVDIHSHSDGIILACPTADSRVRQGITTELTGNCGMSAAPLMGVAEDLRKQAWKENENVDVQWTGLNSYFEHVEKTGISVNHALLLGQGTLRTNAIGNVDRDLTSGERKKLLRSLEEGMERGAFGLSTGLEYTPGSYTSTAEIIWMARMVARYNGFYASHIRNEQESLLIALSEAVYIARMAEIPIQISHLKACGRPNWSLQRNALPFIESARLAGIDILADAYPYTAYSTNLTVLLPSWAREGGAEAIVQRLRDPDTRSYIRREIKSRVRDSPGEFGLIVISRVKSQSNQSLAGKTMDRIAALWNLDPADAILRLIEEEKTVVSFVGHGMSEENVDEILAHPLVMIGSDGSVVAPQDEISRTQPHPRSYGAFPRVLGLYVRERKILDLPSAIRKMTSMPAERIGLRDRGRIAEGMKADLAVFDAATVKDEAGFTDPHRYPTGIVHVLVNGIPVVTEGKHTGARPGRVLRKK